MPIRSGFGHPVVVPPEHVPFAATVACVAWLPAMSRRVEDVAAVSYRYQVVTVPSTPWVQSTTLPSSSVHVVFGESSGLEPSPFAVSGLPTSVETRIGFFGPSALSTVTATVIRLYALVSGPWSHSSAVVAAQVT